jgi:oligosaccharyltransferase complex subunit alpha (ribophorin I)
MVCCLWHAVQDEAKESRMRVASLVEEVQSTQDRRSALYQSYDDAINRFKTSKDSASFQAARKKVDTDYRQLTAQIHSIQQQLKGDNADLAEKVGYF